MTFPTWALVRCQYWATYLGFVLGPERQERSWDKAIAKAVARAHVWGQQELGLQFAAFVFRSYIASTLGFLLQLEELPSNWSTIEAQLIRSLVPGPYRWCLAGGLHGLRRDLGFAQEFVDLRNVSLAAKLRVAHCEADRQGGLGHRRWLRRLDVAERQSLRIVRFTRWRQWFGNSFCHVLASALSQLDRMGISWQAVLSQTDGAPSRALRRQQTRGASAQLQRVAGQLLQAQQQRLPERRMRHKLEH